jgi:hypothetical protein
MASMSRTNYHAAFRAAVLLPWRRTRILEGYERSALSNIGIIAIGLTGNKHLSIMNVNGDGFVGN